jgi:hypothetical protein
MWSESALRFSGRFIVMTTISPSRSTAISVGACAIFIVPMELGGASL